MANLDDLQKLNELKNQGIISQEDFDKKKADILNNLTPQPTEGKSQAIYCVLALFTGCLGIHNFYAGRWKRGLAQLLLTLFSVFTLFLSLIIIEIWVIVNVFAIHTDGQGREFIPSKTAKYICGFIMLAYFLLIFGILLIGGIMGYMEATKRHKANQALDMATRLALAAQTYGDVDIGNINSTKVRVESVADLRKAVERQKANMILNFATKLAAAAQRYEGFADGESKTANELGVDIPEDLYGMENVRVTNNHGIFEVQLGITYPVLLEEIKSISGSPSGSLIRFNEAGLITD